MIALGLGLLWAVGIGGWALRLLNARALRAHRFPDAEIDSHPDGAQIDRPAVGDTAPPAPGRATADARCGGPGPSGVAAIVGGTEGRADRHHDGMTSARPNANGDRWHPSRSSTYREAAHRCRLPGSEAERRVSRRHPGDGHGSPAGGPAGVAGGAARVAQQAVEVVGRRVRGAVGQSGDRDPATDRRWGLAVVAGLALLAVQPVLAVAPVFVATLAPRLTERRRARRHEAAVVDQLPDIVDLLHLTTSAGLPVSGAIGAIGGRPGGVIGGGLVRAAALISRGGSTADALDVLHETGGAAIRPLVDALADHDRYGTPLGPALDRVGVEGRLRRRRQAEEAARRLPITLLFPLVLTTLPAFVALTVVPLLAGSLSSLRM